MHSNMGVAVKRKKQKTGANLCSEQIRFEERRLTASFLEMAGALRCRPSPRAKWDNVAAGGRARYKGRDAVLAGKEVMRDAIRSGERTVIEDSAARVARHFEQMKHAALADYVAIVSGTVTLQAAMTKASKETTDAMHAMMSDAIAPSETAHELTLREINEAIEALLELRVQLVAVGNQPMNRRAAMALS